MGLVPEPNNEKKIGGEERIIYSVYIERKISEQGSNENYSSFGRYQKMSSSGIMDEYE